MISVWLISLFVMQKKIINVHSLAVLTECRREALKSTCESQPQSFMIRKKAADIQTLLKKEEKQSIVCVYTREKKAPNHVIKTRQSASKKYTSLIRTWPPQKALLQVCNEWPTTIEMVTKASYTWKGGGAGNSHPAFQVVFIFVLIAGMVTSNVFFLFACSFKRWLVFLEDKSMEVDTIILHEEKVNDNKSFTFIGSNL